MSSAQLWRIGHPNQMIDRRPYTTERCIGAFLGQKYGGETLFIGASAHCGTMIGDRALHGWQDMRWFDRTETWVQLSVKQGIGYYVCHHAS